MKLKQIIALIGAVILLGLFATALILAVNGAPGNSLMAVIFSIVFLSAVLYAMELMIRLMDRRHSQEDTTDPLEEEK